MIGAEFEKNVRTAMAHAGIHQVAELGRRTGIQRGTLYEWFRGDRQPTTRSLGRLSETLGVSPLSLWPTTEDEPLTVASIELAMERVLRRVLAEAEGWTSRKAEAAGEVAERERRLRDRRATSNPPHPRSARPRPEA